MQILPMTNWQYFGNRYTKKKKQYEFSFNFNSMLLQANIVQRKKDSAAESLQEVRQELLGLENELKLKKSQMRDAEGNEIVTNVQVL